MLIVLRLKNPNIDMKWYFSHFTYSLDFFPQGTTFPGEHGFPWFLAPPDFLGFLLPFSPSRLSTELVSGLGARVPFSGIHASWNSLTLWLFPSLSLLSCPDVEGFALTHILPNLLPMSSANVWTQTARTDYLSLCFTLCSLFPGGSKYKKVSRLNEVLQKCRGNLCPCWHLALCIFEVHHSPWCCHQIFYEREELVHVVPLSGHSQVMYTNHLHLFTPGLLQSVWPEILYFHGIPENSSYVTWEALVCMVNVAFIKALAEIRGN